MDVEAQDEGKLIKIIVSHTSFGRFDNIQKVNTNTGRRRFEKRSRG